MQNTYTLAQRNKIAEVFQPIKGIPQNMTLMQARDMANKARANGFDVVAYNTQAD